MLTTTQSRILHLFATGLSLSEVAAEMDCTRQNIQHHMRATKRALSAKSTIHAVALAVHGGMITPNPDPSSGASGPLSG